MYGNEDGSIPATFEILNLIGWKPHASQVGMMTNYDQLMIWTVSNNEVPSRAVLIIGSTIIILATDTEIEISIRNWSAIH